jgi:hypothetical protein
MISARFATTTLTEPRLIQAINASQTTGLGCIASIGTRSEGDGEFIAFIIAPCLFRSGHDATRLSGAHKSARGKRASPISGLHSVVLPLDAIASGPLDAIQEFRGDLAGRLAAT